MPANHGGIDPNRQAEVTKILPKRPFYTPRGNKITLVVIIVSLILILFAGIVFAVLSLQLKQTPPPQEVTVVIWTRNINKEVMDEIISDFQEDNPYIKVKHEIQSDTDYKERILTRLKSSSPNMANIVEVEESWIDGIYPSLTPITNTSILGRYSSITLNNNSFNGSVYGIPFQFDGIVLAYNKNHLAEIGFSEEEFSKLDWTGLQTKARSLTKTTTKTKNNKKYQEITRAGVGIGSPRTVRNAKNILKLLLIQNESQFYNLQKRQYLFDSKFTEVIDFYGSFTVQNIWNDSMVDDVKSFAEGKTSIILARSKDIYEVQKLNPKLNFSTTTPPKIATLRNISLSKSLVIPNYMPNKAEAIKFLDFLTRPENSIKFFNAMDETVFIPAQITALNKIPKESPYAVFADINTTAQRIKTHNEDDFDKVLDDHLLRVYENYYRTAIPGENTAIQLDPKSLESSLNAAAKKTQKSQN